MSTIDFWKIKHEIDSEIKRLGWSVAQCKNFLLWNYRKRSRLVMTDEELVDCLKKLRNINDVNIIPSVSSGKKARRRRRKS